MRAPTLSLSLSASLLAVALTGCDGCSGGAKEAENAASGPRVYLTTPRMDQVVDVEKVKPPEGEKDRTEYFPVSLGIDLRDYALSEAKRGDDGKYPPGSGQHVHVILDDDPYIAVYDVSRPYVLHVKEEGTHLVRVFPSAGPADAKGAHWHESRKNEGAFAWVRFHVKKKGGRFETFDGNQPFLTYSRPKGDYALGAKDTPLLFPLMVDFYVTNATLSKDGRSVRVTLDDKPVADLHEWKPWFVEAEPAPGEHKVVLEILDRNGNPEPGPFTRAERTFKVLPPK